MNSEQCTVNGELASWIQRSDGTLRPSDAGADPLRLGVGIHTGEGVAGNMHTAQPAFYTAAGDTVNRARQSQEKAIQSQIVARDSVVRILGQNSCRASQLNQHQGTWQSF